MIIIFFITCFARYSRYLEGNPMILGKLNSTSWELHLLQDMFVLILLVVSNTTA